MPRLAKTAYAAIAALVVAGASTGAATVSSPVVTSGPAAPVASHGARSSAALPSPGPAGQDPPLLAVFVGDWQALRPRGGPVHSFACRSAALRHWQCAVRDLAAAQAGWPSSTGIIVLAASSQDDVTVLPRWLGTLPDTMRSVPLVLLGPVAPAGSTRIARQVAALQRLAAARGASFINPVARGWVTASTRARYLSPDGTQLTPAGHTMVAAHLATALAAVRTRT